MKKPINPHQKTKVHPLATNAKNEARTTELKDAMLDFLGQMGQHDHNYLQKLVLAGGDGLTYEKLLQLQRYLQFHDDAYQSLEILVLLLELWHLEWTDLSRMRHIGVTTSHPMTLELFTIALQRLDVRSLQAKTKSIITHICNWPI